MEHEDFMPPTNGTNAEILPNDDKTTTAAICVPRGGKTPPCHTAGEYKAAIASARNVRPIIVISAEYLGYSL
ncbi:MAG: hypothetical protein JJU12_00095 [Chlamydiales bacterium]|nr:hypothetical protein [Chlamydiales bacterium]